MIQARAYWVLLVAVAMGAVAVYLVQGLIRPAEPPETVAAEGPAMTSVVVAAMDLEVGQRLDRVSLSTVSFPAAAVPQGAFTDIQAVLTLDDTPPVVIREIARGEVIMPHRISPPGTRAGLMPRIPSEHRAITISTDEVQGVAGFVLPGDRVDILHTTTAGRADGQLVTRMLMQNIPVLAVDQIASDRRDDPRVARAITLLTTPEEAQKITLAQRVGQVKLALRSTFDDDVTPRAVIRGVDLQTRTSSPNAAGGPPPGPQVQLIRGLNVSSQTVTGNTAQP